MTYGETLSPTSARKIAWFPCTNGSGKYKIARCTHSSARHQQQRACDIAQRGHSSPGVDARFSWWTSSKRHHQTSLELQIKCFRQSGLRKSTGNKITLHNVVFQIFFNSESQSQDRWQGAGSRGRVPPHRASMLSISVLQIVFYGALISHKLMMENLRVCQNVKRNTKGLKKSG